MVQEIIEQEKPLAYVLGTQPFHPLPVELLVRPPTLIPRPETEHWVSVLTSRALGSSVFAGDSPLNRQPFRIVDLGTGTGCISLALTHALSETGHRPVHTIAVDRSRSALALATENAKRCDLLRSVPSSAPPPSHVSLVQADFFSPTFSSAVLNDLRSFSSSPADTATTPPRFDLVVSNPPYIPLHEYAKLDRSVREWEDRGALVGEVPALASVQPDSAVVRAGEQDNDDGLVFYRRITALLDDLLAPQHSVCGAGDEPAPVVAFEVGQGQARAVDRMLLNKGLKTEVVEDPWGIERAVFGHRSGQ
ncbi:hypothetical protein JCM10207_005364 [Rhodosporidiobolus poonsookiae]